MAGNPVETFQRRVGTPPGLQLTLDATVVASGPDTQVCAGSTVLPAVETADDRQGRWRCPWLAAPCPQVWKLFTAARATGTANGRDS